MKLGSGSDGGGTPCMINENNFDRDLRLELPRARYDICDNIMSSRPIFVERGGQEGLLFLTGLARTCEHLREFASLCEGLKTGRIEQEATAKEAGVS